MFSGLEGASAAMRDRGWEVITVDSDPTFDPTIVSDVRDVLLPINTLDLLWASPPCDEFARESMPWSRTGRVPSIDLVTATVELIEFCRPRYWAIENVRGSLRWLRPYLGEPTAHAGPIYLWTNFPVTLPRVSGYKERLSGSAKAERARIPYAVSLAVARTVESLIPLPL